MSAKWSVQPFKGTIADADVFLIIDSEAGPVENKQVLFSTLALAVQTPWRGDIDAATFNLDNLTSVDLNNALGTNPIIFALQSASESTVVFGSNFQLSSGFIDISEIVTPTNPAINVGRLYVKDDGGITNLFFRDSAGTETDLVSGGGGGHVIEDEGTPLTQRAALNFVGAGVVVTDDLGNDASVVTISGGGASPLTTQGDLFGHDLTQDVRIPIGTPNQVLTVGTVPSSLIEWTTLAQNFYQLVQDEGVSQVQRNTIDFVGAGVVVTDIANVTTVTIPGGGGGSLATLTDVDLTGQAIGGLLVNVDGTNWNDLPVGSESDVLTVVAGIPTWQAGGGGSPLTTQGDLFGRNLTVDARIPIGGAGQFLQVQTANPTAIGWASLPIAYDIIQDEGIQLAQQRRINFTGAGVVAVDNAGLNRTDVTITGAAGIAGHVIEDTGTPLTQRAALNFIGFTVADNPGADSTDITAIGGGSPTTTQGDIIGRGLVTDERVAVGVVGQYLGVSTVTPTLLQWKTLFYQTILDEATPVVQRDRVAFVGAGVTVTDIAALTTVTIPGFASPLTTQGDLFGRDVTGDQRIPIGFPGQVLTVQTAQPTQLAYTTPAVSNARVIANFAVVTPANTVTLSGFPAVAFGSNVAYLELICTYSVALVDTIRVTINNLTTASYTTTSVFVSNTGVVTGQNTAGSSTGWGTGQTVAGPGFTSSTKMKINIGGNIAVNARPVMELWESCGGPSGNLYRAGRGIFENTPAPTSITSIEIKTASLSNFEAGSQFTLVQHDGFNT